MRVCGVLLGLILLLVAGCASSPAAAPAALRNDDSVGYTLTLLPGPPAAVRVTLRIRGEADGTSRLAISPSWGGIEYCERFVHDLSVRDADGHECPVTTDPAAPHGWDITHSPGAPLIATYELRPTPTDPLDQFGTHYEPVVRDDLLHLIGQTGLIYPEWLEDAGPVDITMNWSGFREQGWTTVSSFDAVPGLIRRPLSDFRQGMFLAGAPGRLRVHDREIRGGLLRVAILAADWEFADSELVDLVERVVRMEREFVNDFGDPYFLVTLAQTGPRVSPESFSMGGTGLTDCFALFLAPGTTIAPGTAHGEEVLRLLAHEYFHTWIGGRISNEEPEELVYWFSEGFTDFYATRLLRRAGLATNDAWTSRLNRTLSTLWLSPVSRATGEEIRRDFWNRREMQRLPYLRGELVALMLDEEIRRVSNNTRSIDDFLLELLAAAREGEKAQTGRLLDRIERWTSAGFAARVRGIVVDGAMPEPPPALHEPGAVLEIADTYRFDAGFDTDASIPTRKITGVREGSAAHGAGLRDGQEIAGLSIHQGDADQEARVTIREAGQTREIRYLPRGEPLRLPRYRLGPPGAAR